MSDPRQRILVLGGGVAGIELATRLGRARRHNQLDVTLVDSSLVHVWKPMLHTFASGSARIGLEGIGFLSNAARNGYRFSPGEVTGIDRSSRRVTVAPCADDPVRVTIDYDVLVLAIGSRANDFGTPGVKEHCATIDDLSDAEAFHARLRNALILSQANDDRVTVAIVGGGATGVELAAELKQSADRIAGLGGHAAVRLVLIETGDRLLPHFPRHVSDAARQTLTSLGIEVRTGTEVVSADAQGFALKGDRRIDADILCWAAGVKAPDVLKVLDLPLSKTGQVEVGADLRSQDDDRVYAIGDCARCTDAAGKPVPATAQAAREQAIHLAGHLDRALSTGGEIPDFRYDDKGSIVSLGDFNGWGTLGRYQFGGGLFRGLSARAAHGLLYRQHQFEVLGWRRGACAWIADAFDRLAGSPVR